MFKIFALYRKSPFDRGTRGTHCGSKDCTGEPTGEPPGNTGEPERRRK
nr:MAG TPA: hypothetical protein [Caudoviricetes sp.]